MTNNDPRPKICCKLLFYLLAGKGVVRIRALVRLVGRRVLGGRRGGADAGADRRLLAHADHGEERARTS